ncbi:MAG: hypothetical protein WAS21_31190 [Geminicoccaceae bacterium]
MPDIATAALIRKRAELAGEIEALDATLSQLRADLAHLDAAIRIMSPDTDPEAIRPKKPSRKGCDWFGRGELARMVLDVLREQGPLGHAEIARAIMERKGLPAGDAVAVKRVAGMVKGAMHRRAGRMRSGERTIVRTMN